MKKTDTHNDTFLAKWMASEISNEELKTLVSKEDYHAYLKLKKSIEVIEGLDRPVNDSFSAVKHKIKNRKKNVMPLYSKWAIGIAASILVLFGVFNFFSDSIITFNTNYGESKYITLKDGSELILNSKSQLSYNEDKWDENRLLKLEGEAYFKVAKGKTFTVKTKNGNVQVLGTQFNVNSFEDFFDVLCYEGKVSVNTEKDNQILNPNDGFRKVNGFKSESYSSKSAEPTWINGETTYKSTPLYYVIKTFENTYNVEFNAKDIDTSTSISGVFPHDNIDIALMTVFETLDITFTKLDKRNIKLSYNK
jgi:ferric-dicitrate binding protein FerR (iron transport regulator)